MVAAMTAFSLMVLYRLLVLELTKLSSSRNMSSHLSILVTGELLSHFAFTIVISPYDIIFLQNSYKGVV